MTDQATQDAPTDAQPRPAVAGQVERSVRPLRAAYADPPYLGLAQAFYGSMHAEAAEYDNAWWQDYRGFDDPHDGYAWDAWKARAEQAAPAAPQPEPVAWRWKAPNGGAWVLQGHRQTDLPADWPQEPLYAAPAPDTAEQVRALEAEVEALRGIARWGTGDMLEAAFTGFTALPAPAAKRGWREVLGASGNESLANIQAAYRRLASQHHPDKGGSAEKMAEINAAWEEAQRELS